MLTNKKPTELQTQAYAQMQGSRKRTCAASVECSRRFGVMEMSTDCGRAVGFHLHVCKEGWPALQKHACRQPPLQQEGIHSQSSRCVCLQA